MFIYFQTVTAFSNKEIIQQFCQKFTLFQFDKTIFIWIYARTAHLAVHMCINTIAKPKDQEYQTEFGKWDKNLQPFKRHGTEQMGCKPNEKYVTSRVCDYTMLITWAQQLNEFLLLDVFLLSKINKIHT